MDLNNLKKILLFWSCMEYLEYVVSTGGRFNPAYNQPTYQSSTYGAVYSSASSLAVDDNKGTTYGSGSCTHTEFTVHTWWAVDLGQVYTVYSVTVTNRNYQPSRLLNFTILGSNVGYNLTEASDVQICAYQKDPISVGGTEKIQCISPLNKRYIIVNKTMTKGPNLQPLTLCNFEVSAACPSGRYGENCSFSCSSHCRSDIPCDIYNGSCHQCNSGYTGDMCQIDCPSGTYGDRCKNTCSPNCLSSCDQFLDSGSCIDGKCKPGYFYGGNCTTECPDLLYGRNCSERCSVFCRNGCTKDAGHCKDGCLPGFIGDKCQTECPDGTYGVKCETTCSSTCINPICDKYSLTGTCSSSCKPGYMGDNCTVLCPVERYGSGCSSKCHCSSGTCSHITGVCDTGCAKGWLGETCNKHDKTVKNIDTENKPGGIIGPAVGGTVGVLVALAAVVLVGVICYRRGLSKRQGGKEEVNAVALEKNRIYMNTRPGAMADNADYTNLAVTDNRAYVNVENGESGDPQYTVLTPDDSTYQDINGSTNQNKEQ